MKGSYLHHKEVKAAQGIKIAANGLESAVAGTQVRPPPLPLAYSICTRVNTIRYRSAGRACMALASFRRLIPHD